MKRQVVDLVVHISNSTQREDGHSIVERRRGWNELELSC